MSDFLDALALQDNNVIDEKFYKPPEVFDFTSENLDIQFDTTKQQSYLFYVESPAQEAIGYREDLRAFFIKATPYTSKYYPQKGEDFLNQNIVDGDTMYFDLKTITDNNTAFAIGDKSYSSFSKFLTENNQRFLIIRTLGIDCPELPHYRSVYLKTSELNKYTKTVTFGEARKNSSFYILTSLYDNNGNARLDSEKIEFFITNESYCEISKNELKDDDPSITELKIVYKNEANEHPYTYIKEARDCQKALIDLLNQASDIRLVIDQQTLNRKPSDFSTPYDAVNWLTSDGLLTQTFSLIEELWKQAFGYQQYQYETYNAPGQDTYGRSLGTIYAKIWVEELQAEMWVNTAKYILYHYDKYTKAVPSYSSNPSEAYHNNFFSPIFKLSTYDKKYIELLDGFTNVTSKLIEERDEWYSAITGLDIDYIKEHSVILGDCVLTVPPMSIRSSTETDHFKIPLLRSRGSIVKSLPRSQKVIELDVYFNNESGINGVAKEIIGKQGQTSTYYMNGLRSLIAMFKLTPFLPIENDYINNNLLVDAVTLINLNVTTVPNYPKCLKATLTLAEFNYSIFMPELPGIENHNTFAQSIHYPAMRWYYQRLLQTGESIKNLDFNSEAYITKSYGSNTALVPMSFDNSRATFYIPNRAQLETRLQIMNDTKPILTQDQLTDEMKVGAKRLKELMLPITNLGNNTALISGLTQFFAVSTYNTASAGFLVSSNFTSDAVPYTTQNIPVYPLIFSGESNLYQSYSSVLRKMPITYRKEYGLQLYDFSLTDLEEMSEHSYPFLTQIYNAFNRSLGVFGIVDCFARTENDTLYIGAVVPLPIELTQSSFELKVIARKICSYLNIDKSEAEKVIKYTENGRMGVPIEIQFPIEPLEIDLISGEKSKVYKLKKYNYTGTLPDFTLNADGLGLRVINYLYSIVDESIDSGLGDTVEKSLIEEKRDTMLNSAMGLKFVKYDAGDLLIEQVAINYGNTLSNMSLNMVDGKAYQYCGAQDMQIQMSLVTNSELTINALTHLPELSAEYARSYRRVLNCWPLRIDCEFTKLFGICEVLIENVQTDTIPNQPGFSRVTLTLTAVDRTVRRREALSRIDTESNAGSIKLGNRGKLEVKTYFDLKTSLAKAELYPDLELPTVDELLEAGFEIYRDKNIDINKPNRVFVDPDFYFIYGQALACEIFRNNFMTVFEQDIQEYDLTDTDGAYTTFILNKSGQGELTNKNSIAESQKSFYQEMSAQNYNHKDYSKEIYKTVSEKAKCTLKFSQSLAEIGTAFWNITNSAKLPFRESTCDLMPQTVTSVHLAQKQKIINYIDDFLTKSIDENGIKKHNNVADSGKTLKQQTKQFKSIVSGTIQEMHITNDAFIDLLFAPINEIDKEEGVYENAFGSKMYDSIRKKLTGILLAYADTFSGETYYNNQTIVIGDDADSKQNINWQAKTYMNSDKNNAIPYCKISGNTGAIYASSIDEAISNGYSFGPFGIQIYHAAQLREFYPGVNFNQNASYFMDPYYMTMQINGDIEGIKAHKKKLLTQPGYAAIACFRQLLVFYKYYINNGKLISLYEIARSEAYEAWNTNKVQVTEKKIKRQVNKDQKEIKKKQEEVLESFLTLLTALSFEKYPTEAERKAVAYGVLNLDEGNVVAKAIAGVNKTAHNSDYYDINNMLTRYTRLYKEAKENPNTEEETLSRYKKLYELCVNHEKVDLIEFAEDIIGMVQKFDAESDFNTDIATQTFKQIAEDEEKMFVGRFIAMACSLLDTQTIHPLIMEKNADALNNLITVVNRPDIANENTVLKKFIYALDGRKVIDISNIGDIPSTLEAKYRNYISERISIERSKNPRQYLRDSFYDMIKYDKRGRMLRAFPTYYMFFVDEGREIGLWKLHDNFYSSTAIAEIEITKSRKIAADTAHITLSNLFNSYTQDDKDFIYDLDNPANNVGIKYKVQDAFNALFSPRAYFAQEEKGRLNTSEPLTTNLTPGTRLHVRMGYGSNAAELPIVFNGQVAEISNGEVCEIVAQGDGAELLNPIQGYTDSSDVQLEGKFFIKKFFAKWLATGATPKTILGSLLIADGSWMDDKIQKVTNGYVKASNPFGIYHFGDMKFDTIFKGSECIQNLFEANSRALYEATDKYDINVGLETNYQTQGAPILSIDINGKTVWDISHVCASVAPDYKIAIAPFELRSTLFMGTGRDYYAYEYAKESASEENNSYIYEKRKPFEQYHYYTSYSDIIANHIVADGSQVKTNAVGIYNETRSFGSIKTKETSRLFVDID